MTWYSLFGSLPPGEAERLANELTAGYGAVSRAAQLMTRDGGLAEIAAVLARAETWLTSVWATLMAAQGLEPPRRSPLITVAGPPGLTWQMYLHAIPSADAQAQLALLLEVAKRSRESGARVTGDGKLAAIAADLGAASTALGQVRRALTASLRDLERPNTCG